MGQHTEHMDLERECPKAAFTSHDKQKVLKKFKNYLLQILLVLKKKKKIRGQEGQRPADVNLKGFYIGKSILTRTTGLHFLELLESLRFQSFVQ